MIAYFCGVWPGRRGHHCYLPSGEQAPLGAPVSPWGYEWHALADIDAAFRLLPADTPGQKQPEGVRAHRQEDGWTLVGWWDRSGDERYKSVALFAFGALLTADEAEAEARRQFPRVFRRMDLHLGRTTQGAAIQEQVRERLAHATDEQWRRVAAVLGIPTPP